MAMHNCLTSLLALCDRKKSKAHVTIKNLLILNF